MYQVFESIKVHQHAVYNLSYHLERMKKTAAFLSFRLPSLLNLEAQILEASNGNLQKAKVLYNENDLEIHLEDYSIRNISQFILVKNDGIKYPVKFTQRKQLMLPSHLFSPTNEPLFTKHDKFTDSGFANIVFLKNKIWYTPSTPLLLGTKRQYYLDLHRIQSTEITIDSYQQFSHVGLINAMIDLGELVLPISAIQIP
ncbi:MAG TPA: aminotransferase class IV [Chitinophagaceae bacterium]|nr:aminotransferase class IV [Chitinophagaceae bacterium]